MGIGNSTAAAALSSAMTAIAPARIVGRGTGLDDVGVIRKIEVVERALHRHRDHLGDGLNALAAVGGLEIAAMTGACLGGAASRVAVIVDGFIATAAAAVATRMSPRVREYLIFAHRSAEGGHAAVLEALGVRPLLSLDMRLGEGTGSVLAMNLLESALTLFHEMATFAAAGVSSKLQ
jgi:nicotinate-nucleotide--dimethylbenzimidazole phosphoribosyltransferase